ncbi:MAG: hypothetical protein Q7U91_10620 [Sideroxyarcus sp.]|nr:hypothetical protein [Sideroxyarcus sp.]
MSAVKVNVLSVLGMLRRSARSARYTFAVLVLSGCAGIGSSIPPEQMAKLATVECADFYSLRSVDAESVGVFQSSVNVSSGMHSIEISANCGNRHCPSAIYRFNAKPGYLYRLLPSNSIAVLDRNDRYQRKVDELHPVNQGGVFVYVTREEQQGYARNVVNQAQAARAAQLERRRQNLPLIRKVGARICQLQGQILYIGFVESLADEKLQIRVADAVVNENHNVHLGDFAPSVVWDSPLNWDLCE